MPKAHPMLEISLNEYFHTRLGELSQELNSPPHEDTLWYMGNMLARFGDKEQLFTHADGHYGLKPLALLYQDANEASTSRERCFILRQLGDLSLFLGALFPENYARKGIGKGYFVGLGGGAYDYLAENAQQNRHIFSELATTFTRMLVLIAKACSRKNFFDANDVLKLYQRWQQSRNPLHAEQLKALGIYVLNR